MTIDTHHAGWARRPKRRHGGALRAGAALAAAGLLASCASGTGTEGGDETLTLTFTSMVSEEHALAKGANEWMKLVEEESGGKVQFEAFYDGALCDTAEAFGCIETGRADIGIEAAIFNPELTLGFLRGLGFQTLDPHAITLATQQLREEFAEIDEEYASFNQKVLYTVGADPVVIGMNAASPLDSLADLEGKSLRATSVNAVTLEILGANPVAVANEDIYESLQRGVIQGVFHTSVLFADDGSVENAPNVYGVDDMGINSAINLNINLDTWNGLPEDVQAAMDRATEQVVEERTLFDIQAAEVDRACQEIVDGGGVVGSIGGDAEGEAWKEASMKELRRVWNENASGTLEDPDEMFDRYIELIDEYEDPESPTFEETCAAVTGD